MCVCMCACMHAYTQACLLVSAKDVKNGKFHLSLNFAEIEIPMRTNCPVLAALENSHSTLTKWPPKLVKFACHRTLQKWKSRKSTNCPALMALENSCCLFAKMATKNSKIHLPSNFAEMHCSHEHKFPCAHSTWHLGEIYLPSNFAEMDSPQEHKWPCAGSTWKLNLWDDQQLAVGIPPLGSQATDCTSSFGKEHYYFRAWQLFIP